MSVLILTVNEVMRTLTSDGQYPFVENDKTVDIVRFALNTGFTDIVLDEHSALRVMYQRPGESQVRAQTLVYYDTDGLRSYYDWHLLSADLAEKGTLTVALCILRTDSTVEEWHTTPCAVRVLSTIHTDDSDEGDESITPTVAQRVAVLESVVQSIAGGAPTVVDSASDMTDTDKIYILTTDSKWYYYNLTSSAWVAGGEYGAVSTDTTLTQSGIPADAKKTGDEIGDLKSALVDIVTREEIEVIKNTFVTDRSETIDSSTDIDDIMQPGIYRWTSSNVPVNSPTVVSASMLVISRNQSTGVLAQLIITANGEIIVRARSLNAWRNWKNYSNTDKTLSDCGALSGMDDMDNITTAGYYNVYSDDLPANLPVQSAGTVLVMRPNWASSRDYPLTQVFFTVDQMYYRMKTTHGFTRWKIVISNGTDEDLIPFTVTEGILGFTGTVRSSSGGICLTHSVICEPGSALHINKPDNWVVTIYQGDSQNCLTLTDRLSHNSDFLVIQPYVGITFYKVDSSGNVIATTMVADFDSSITIAHTKPDASMIEIYDAPQSQGVYNLIRRAKQAANIVFTTASNLPTQYTEYNSSGIIPSGYEMDGVPYSSVRVEGLYVPQCVNFQAFMTALLNQDSYIYTKQSYAANSKTYYGTVCSSFVSWVLAVDNVVLTTHSFGNYPGVVQLPQNQQNIYSLKLGDFLNKPDKHIRIITGIIRNLDGTIKYIEVSEARMPVCDNRRLTPAEFIADNFNNGYIACRFEGIDDIPYTATPWFHVGDETGNPVYDRNLIPRRGDQANWRPAETIEIDVFGPTNYTQYAVTDRETGETVMTGSVGNMSLASAHTAIQITTLSSGKYHICLTDGTNESTGADFTIMNTSVTYLPQGNGKVKVSFSSTTGTPSSILWICNNSESADYQAIRDFYILTETDLSRGYAIVQQPEDTSDAPDGKWLMNVMFKTEFGLYSADQTEVTVA